MMKRRGWEMKLVLFLLALAGVMVVLAGCGGPKQTTQVKQPPAQEQPKAPETAKTTPPAPVEETKPPQTEEPQRGTGTPTTPTTTPTASPPQVVKVESFPENGYVVAGGSAAFHAQIKSTSAVSGFAVELKLDGNVVSSQSVSLTAQEQKTLRFQVEKLDAAGKHTVEILNWKSAISVIEPASSPLRPGTIPIDAQVITKDEGITDTGI
ncbi:MAG: hypothetical protein A2Z21_07300, partial [Candidatus Fraserbacteria bacterium RBG_16_55_9]